jgi:hypothetical protein
MLPFVTWTEEDMDYISVTEAAATIRAQLKARGWNNKQVSVRSQSYSGGSSLHVSVKDPRVPLAVVKEIAESFEDIDRDHFTGEILAGGNRYVHVEFDSDATEWLVDGVAAMLPDDTASLVSVGPFQVYREAANDEYFVASRRSVGRDLRAWSKRHMARQLVEALLADTFGSESEEFDAHGEAFLRLVGEAA